MRPKNPNLIVDRGVDWIRSAIGVSRDRHLEFNSRLRFAVDSRANSSQGGDRIELRWSLA